MTILPKTAAGKWSVGLLISFVLCMIIFYAVIELFHYRGCDTFFENIPLAITILLAWASGAGAFICGVISFFKTERSACVFLTSLLGLLIFLWGMAEAVSSH